MRISVLLSLFLGVFFSLQYSAQAQLPCDPDQSECRFKYTLPDGKSWFYYYSNHDLAKSHLTTKRVIIAIQGNKRNPKGFFNTLYSTVESQKLLNETIVIAPGFKGNDYEGKTDCTDSKCDALEPHEVYWSTAGWKQGDVSLDPSRISSYEVVDLMIKKLAHSQQFSALSHIVLTGHSAGGQFTQRYAVGTVVEEQLGEKIKLEFLVSNPSSYLYLDNNRPVWAGLYLEGGKYPEFGLNAQVPLVPEFKDPYHREVSPYFPLDEFKGVRKVIKSGEVKPCDCTKPPCPYERFKFGFEMQPHDHTHYMSFESARQKSDRKLTVEGQTARFLNKKVTYIMGQNDNSTPTGSPESKQMLDLTCGSNFQGPDRLTRATYYFESLSRFGAHQHRLLFAAQVGHDSPEIYRSYQAKRTLFGGDLPVKEYLAPLTTLKQGNTSRYLDTQEKGVVVSSAKKTESQLMNQIPTHTWILTRLGGNEYTIQNGHNLLYLASQSLLNGQAFLQEYKNSPTQRWEITPVKNAKNRYTIRNQESKRDLTANWAEELSVLSRPSQSDLAPTWLIEDSVLGHLELGGNTALH